jgi:hypothetical protein
VAIVGLAAFKIRQLKLNYTARAAQDVPKVCKYEALAVVIEKNRPGAKSRDPLA